jgi:hypothetical protein
MSEGVTQDSPAERTSGLSPRRERIWGIVGGAVGTAFGVGSALTAVYLQGASWTEAGPYPGFFRTAGLAPYDLFLAGGAVAGLGFLAAALWFSRAGRYPRTDAFGAGLIGAILLALVSSLFFLRLFAMGSGG